MIGGSLGRRYARALMSIGSADGSFERMGGEVKAIADTIRDSKELREVLTNPAFPRGDREKLLGAILERLGASQTVKNFARLLLERERLVVLPDIARELETMIDDKAERVKAVVTAAIPLSSREEEELTQALTQMSGKRVELETARDPELLGGIVAKVGDTVYDGSLRTQLARMREQLTS